MVLHAADLKRFRFVSPANSTQVTPNTLLDFRREPTLAILGRENHMQADGCVGVSHLTANLIRCRAATQSFASRFRGLKPTAILHDRSAVDLSSVLAICCRLKFAAVLHRAAVHSIFDRSAVTDGSRGLQPTGQHGNHIVSHRDTGTGNSSTNSCSLTF